MTGTGRAQPQLIIWKIVTFLVIHDFTGFASTINTEFEIIFLNVPFSESESLIDAQFAKAFCFFDKCTNFSVIDHQS